MQVLRLSLLLMSFTGVAAWSQVSPDTLSSAGRGEVFGSAEISGSNPSGATIGGGGGVGYDFTRRLGLVGQVMFIQTTCCVVNNIRVYDYLVGPRFWLTGGSRVRPWVDGMFGGQYLTNSSNHHSWYYINGGGPAVGADVGAEFELTRHLAARGQVGYLFSRFAAGGTSVTNSRVTAQPSIVYRF